MNIEVKIQKLKALKKRLLRRKSKQQDTIISFYNRSLKMRYAADGMSLIIGKDFLVPPRISSRGLSHQKVCQDIFDELVREKGIEPVDFDKVPDDFGNYIPLNYGYIFIRMASPLNGATIIYYPNECTEYQTQMLEQFNNRIKEFNKSSKYKAVFEYNGKSEIESYDLDELIERLNQQKYKKK